MPTLDVNGMLGDTNRIGVFNPNGGSVSQNIVGSGSNGQLYWSLFNIEGESDQTSRYVTYASLADSISGARSVERNWSSTADSNSAAGSRGRPDAPACSLASRCGT